MWGARVKASPRGDVLWSHLGLGDVLLKNHVGRAEDALGHAVELLTQVPSMTYRLCRLSSLLCSRRKQHLL